MKNSSASLLLLAACGDNVLPPVPTIFTLDEAGRICATLETCFPIEFGRVWNGSISGCTTYDGYVPEPGTMAVKPIATLGFEPAFTRLYDCILSAAGDCSAAAACFAQVGSSSTCMPDSLANGQCNGSILSGCTADGITFATDCAAFGETCGRYPAFFATYNGCVMPCTMASQFVCDGSNEVWCLDNAMVIADCAAAGDSCANGMCASSRPPPTCDPTTFVDHCDGNVVVRCDSQSHVEDRSDCSIWPTKRRCAIVDYYSNDVECVMTGTECRDETDRCDGDDIAYCHDGYNARVSCTAIGFSTCNGGRCVP